VYVHIDVSTYYDGDVVFVFYGQNGAAVCWLYDKTYSCKCDIQT